MKRLFQFPVFVGLALLAGCAEDNLGAWGLEVEVRDARTGAPAAYDATVVVRDGSYADTVRGRDQIIPEHKGQDAVVRAAFQRTGTFHVTVLHPEYRTWQREDVRVSAGRSANPVGGDPIPSTVRVVAGLERPDGR